MRRPTSLAGSLLLLPLSLLFSPSTVVSGFSTSSFEPSSLCSFLRKTILTSNVREQKFHQQRSSLASLKMMVNNKSSILDPVTYLRTEWVSAALVANQTPRAADKVLQLGVGDGRIVNFVPRTVREIITSSAESKDGPEGGGLTVSAERQLRQMAERRQTGASIKFSNQPADDLKDTPSSSVDVVVSLQAAQRMHENGLDWKQSIQEAGRVLKPGGRFLFVESALVNGESYLDYLVGLSENGGIEIKGGLEGLEAIENNGDQGDSGVAVDDGNGMLNKLTPLFDEVGYDQVDMVLQPHIAGVAIKASDADLTVAEKAQKRAQEESDRLVDLSFDVFERGLKKRRRKKKKSEDDGNGEEKK